MPRQPHHFIPGYQHPLKRAFWETVKTLGGPQVPASVWLALNVFAAFLLMVYCSFRLMLIPGILWVVGHVLMVALTIYDEHWFDVLLAQLVFRYQDVYEA